MACHVQLYLLLLVVVVLLQQAFNVRLRKHVPPLLELPLL